MHQVDELVDGWVPVNVELGGVSMNNEMKFVDVQSRQADETRRRLLADEAWAGALTLRGLHRNPRSCTAFCGRLPAKIRGRHSHITAPCNIHSLPS